jgi:glycosyltransferase involved in cell wall biosynthesis
MLYSLKNKAIMMAKHEVIWLLDDDLIIDNHTLFILRLYHMFLKHSRPLIVPHYANPGDPDHYQAPFSFMPQPPDWDKVRVWPAFAGMSFWKQDWERVGGIDEQYDEAMGFADLDFGIMMFNSGCQALLVDGITCFIDDRESGGSHRDRFIFNHQNGHKFMKKWPTEAAKYGITD